MIALLIAKIHINKQISIVVAPKSICSQWVAEIAKWVKLCKMQEIFYKGLQTTQSAETVQLLLEKCKSIGGILVFAPWILESEIFDECLKPFIANSNVSTLVLDEGHESLNKAEKNIAQALLSLNISNRIVLV